MLVLRFIDALYKGLPTETICSELCCFIHTPPFRRFPSQHPCNSSLIFEHISYFYQVASLRVHTFSSTTAIYEETGTECAFDTVSIKMRILVQVCK